MTAWDDAYNAVVSQCQTSIYPTLDEDDIATLVDNAESYAVWSASTAYSEGAMVAPTVRNGHVYRCLVAGTSSTTEPYWPLYGAPDDRVGLTQPFWAGYVGPLPGSTVTDANTLVWIEAGPDSGEQYRIREAVYNGWLLKAAKASAGYDGTIDRNQYKRSQVYQQCIDMAQRYVPTSIS